ncbi:MAG: CPBP family intramembrane metalloprotease [Bacteroidaceae bacterium]|nr:CPBP family intramembrane metalloprotease [Bacteroidaceae bacterium]
MGVAIGLNPNTDQSLWMSITLLVSSIITAIVLLVIPHYDLRHSFKSVGCKYEVAVVGFIASLVGLFSFDILSERLNLENLMEELFMGMSKNVFGMLAIGLFGPICEEIVFRGGIMRPLLKKGLNPWIAILVSSIVFGLAHGNPAQIPFAALVGVIFGVVYYRTGSLVLTTLCHILNNSFSVLLMNIYGDKANDMTFDSMLGHNVATILMVACCAICVGLLYWFWKKTEQTFVDISKAENNVISYDLGTVEEENVNEEYKN